MEKKLFEKTPIPKAYMTLAVPVVLSMIVQLVYNMVDTFFIAKTGNTSLIAGVSVCAPLFTLMLAFGDIFALGGSSYLSRLLGARKLDDVRRLSVFCFYSAAVFGIIVAVVMLILQNPILDLLGADKGTYQYARGYYQVIVAGSPFIILSLVPSNLLRTVGRPNASMVVSIVGAVINMILDPILIFGLDMGARGAATATVIGYIFSDLLAIIWTARSCDTLSINLKRLQRGVSGHEIGAIFAIGLPASITNLTQTIGVALTNRSLLEYGSDSIAVMGIVMKIVIISTLIIVGLAFGGQPLTGYTYGSGNRERFSLVLKFAYKIVCGIGAVVAALIAVFAKPLVGIFLNDPDLLSQGVTMLRLQMPGMIFMAMGLVTICTFQAAGLGLQSLVLSMCRQGVVFAVAVAVLKVLFGYMGVISAQFAADIVTAVIAILLLISFLRKNRQGQA